jgi:uncharacterized protein involved in propanediol utilization
VKFALPPIESAADVVAAMNSVTSALARGAITPSDAERLATVVENSAWAIYTRSVFIDQLQILGLNNFDEPMIVIAGKQKILF